MDTMKNIEKENIGKTIRVLRTAASMKQKILAEAVGIQPNSLSLIESGKREPSLGLLRSIAKELDVPMGLFFWKSHDYLIENSLTENTLLIKLRKQLLELEALRLADRASFNNKIDE